LRASELVERTHGRWPLLAAAAALPATLALASRDDPLAWAPLPVYFWHQTEEWVWPGGFLPWVNREVMGSGDDEFPITRRLGFAINVGGGWALAAASGVRGSRSPALGAAVHAMLAANVVFHVMQSARARRYTPGLVTAAGLLGPVSAAGLATIARDPRGGPRTVARGAVVGLAGFAAPLVAIRRRVAGGR
jgi:Protein of unknown function with HXXEE motif